MKASILLSHNENTKKIEEEEKMNFLRNLLGLMGVPVDEFWTSNDLSIDQRIMIQRTLLTFGVSVIDDLDGEIIIYVDGEKVGQWFKPTYKLKRDLSELNPRKQFFLEMEINCWSIFESDENA